MNGSRFRKFKLILIFILMPMLAYAGQVEYLEQNTDHQICPDFYKVLKRANLQRLSDGEACNLRFSSIGFLPSKNLSSPNWVKINVKDPVEMYERMVDANYPSYSVARRPTLTKGDLDQIRLSYEQGNL